jgi:hypothetical protein
MSPEGMDFVRRCLAVEEGSRMDAEQASGHPWLASAAAVIRGPVIRGPVIL